MQPEATPPAGSMVRDKRPVVAGIDIGGTKLAAVLVDENGRELAAATSPAPRGGEAVLREVAMLVRRLESDAGCDAAALGVGAAGIIDSVAGRILAASEVFTDWVGRWLRSDLEALLQLPVAVTNDVNAFLLGEVHWGALSGVRDALGVALGTGVGGAILLDGVIFEGRHGAAAEIGHTPRYSDHVCTCGGRGHLETVASGRSIGLRYAERAGGPSRTGVEVALLAEGGDATAQQIYAEAGVALANAILSTTTLFDVDHVVIGGGVARAWHLIEPSYSVEVAGNPPVSGRALVTRTASLNSPAIGAATVALQTGVFAN